MVQAITDSNFKTKTDAGLTLTDFWATWCGPCKMQSPIIEELAEEIDFADIYKIDVDENQDTAQELGHYEYSDIANQKRWRNCRKISWLPR